MYIDIEVTKNCNLRCSYCYIKNKKHNYLTKGEAEKTVNFIFNRVIERKENHVTIDFLGGEPLLNFDIIKSIVKLANKLSIEKNIIVDYAMTTNGTLFNKDVAEFCINNNFNIKLSIDGTKYYNDLNRNTPNNSSSYELIHKNLENFYYYQSELKKSVQVSMVITKNNCKNFIYNIKHIFSLGLTNVDIALNFYDNWDENDFKIIEEEFFKTTKYIFECEKQGKSYLWTIILTALRKQFKFSENYFCGAGDTSLYVAVDGSIYGCAVCQKEKFKVGSINSGLYKDRIIDFDNFKSNLDTKCISCNLGNTCDCTSCIALNYDLTGDLYKVPYSSCSLSKITHKLGSEIISNDEWVDMLHKKMSYCVKTKRELEIQQHS